MLTQKELKKVLNYNPESGVFTRKNVSCDKKAYTVAGCIRDDGYLVVKISGFIYRLHRLAFLYVEGYFPEHQVDHINGKRNDNRWKNLREVSAKCNSQNKNLDKRNKCGAPGVGWHLSHGKWYAQAKVCGKAVHLGAYDTVLEAALARCTWEVNCEEWTCNCRGVLIKAICDMWPSFNLNSVR